MQDQAAEIGRILSDPNMRREYLRHDLFAFGLYYFRSFFTSLSADFHRQWAKDMASGKHVLLVAFRESAKTVWAMISLIHRIVYRTNRFPMYYCFDLEKAKGRLFDVAVQLKTNALLKSDFGSLWPTSLKIDVDEREPEKRSVGEFITRNRVKVKAGSMGQSPRGELYVTTDGAFRPDHVTFDDLDTIRSVTSPDLIDKNTEWVRNEVLGGISDNASVLFLGNVIKRDGIVPRFERIYSGDPSWIVRRVAVEEGGEITWPQRFVHTDAQAELAISEGRKAISLESKRRLL